MNGLFITAAMFVHDNVVKYSNLQLLLFVHIVRICVINS